MEREAIGSHEKYLDLIHESVRHTLNYEQKQEIVRAMQRLGVPGKKHFVDLRFTFWFIKRWYFVLLAGRDVRKKKRDYGYTRLKKGAIVFIQLVFYALIACFLLLGLYLFKSALGIDIFPGCHVWEIFQ